MANGSSGPAPELPADLTAKLEGYFAASNQELAELLGRDLPWWSGLGAGRHRVDGPRSSRPSSPAIAFNETSIEGRELDYVRASIRSGHPVLRRRLLDPGRASCWPTPPAPRRCC